MSLLTESISFDLLVIALSLLGLAVAYFKRSFTYWERKGVPHPKPSIPLGNSGDLFLRKTTFGENTAKVYTEFKAKGLRYCGYYFMNRPTLIAIDLDLVKNVITKDFMHFTDRGNYVNEVHDPLSGHLFSLRGQKWKNLRTKLTPTFTSGKMKMMFQTLVDCSDALLAVLDEEIRSSNAIDIKDVVGRYTTDIIGSVAFGIDCNSLKDPNSDFRTHGKKVFTPTTLDGMKGLCSFIMPRLFDLLRISINEKDVERFFMNIVQETVAYREKNQVKRKDFMHLLIQLKNNVKIVGSDDSLGEIRADEGGEDGMTVQEMAAQAFVFFLAGFETSSTTLTFCLYELVSNLEIQEKVRREVRAVLERHDGQITYNGIMEMTYMDKCINETLRKYPPLSILMRECTKEYKVPDSDLTLEKGTLVFLPILGIQTDPEYFPKPEVFDPERFSPENKAQRHPYTWLPFGEGPRVCIGLRFGMMQTKVALTILLSNYRFTLNEKTVTPITFDPASIVTSTNGGMWLNAERLS